MEVQTFIKDEQFLKALDNSTNKFFLVRIEILDMNEQHIRNIEGKVLSGSTINLNGSSSVRRTCNITLIAEEDKNDLTDIKHLLSANKRVRIFEGFKNTIDSRYGEYVWFPLGIFVISQPSITHNLTGCTIQLSCKDKMCLLNGESAGILPTTVVFSEYEQIIGLKDLGNQIPWDDTELIPNNYTVYKYKKADANNNNTIKTYYATWTKESGWKETTSEPKDIGKSVSVPQRYYDIIQTVVHTFGGIPLSKIFINDVPLQIKQLIRYTGDSILYFRSADAMYTTDQKVMLQNPTGGWREFTYNDDIGYIYTDFTFPTKSTLVSGIGDNVCTILDKIKNALGNYEYFFDIEGNFVFQEIKNYLNNSYDPTIAYRLDNGREVVVQDNDLTIVDGTNYIADFSRETKSVYTFTEGNGLISSYVNTPNYNNIKNDFHIWGELENNKHAIHYHLAIKEKPKEETFTKRRIVYLKDGDKYTGKIRLANNTDTGEDVDNNYIPQDWRAELYLQGLEDKARGMRPDVYKQELLDLFDSIYDFKKKAFKTDAKHPNSLEYFFDYLEPIDDLYDCSIDVLGQKVYSYKQDKIRRLYNVDVPNYIMVDTECESHERSRITKKCDLAGQPFSNVDHRIFALTAVGTIGYTAQEVARELLYQYTQYNEVISIQSIPIYYLDVNSRITVYDERSGIHGDYIINSISLPLNAGALMTINASRALERI